MEAVRVHGHFHCVGGDAIFLTGKYDPNQLWLPFMRFAVFLEYEKPEDKPLNNKVNQERRKSRLQIRDRDHQLQRELPFASTMRITSAQMKRLSKFGHPTWERSPNGELLEVQIQTDEPRSVIEEWCMETCKAHFHLLSNRVLTFETYVDAIVAKMRFS